jgi:hypothetical protein
MKNILLTAIAATALSVAAFNATATVVTSDTGFFVIEDFQGFDGLVTKGPEALGGGASASSSVDSTLGASAVDLVDNGTWGAGNKFAGIGDLSFLPSTNEGFVGSMTFDLGYAYSGAGAYFSIYNDGAVSGEITIEALGAGNLVLESTTFAVDFNDFSLNNASQFYGFNRASAYIAGFRVSGDGFVLDNLSVVPEPSALALMLVGGLAGAFVRRKA